MSEIINKVTPAETKTSWVTTPTVVSTTTLAAACALPTPRRWASRTPATSPPMLATGNKLLMDSRIQRIQAALATLSRHEVDSSSRHESALNDNGRR